MADEAGTTQAPAAQPATIVSQPDILIRYEPALSSTNDHPGAATAPTPAAKQGPQLSVGPAGENAPVAEPVVAEPATPEPATPEVKPEEAAVTAAEQAAEAAAAKAGKKPFSERISDIARDRDAAIKRATEAEARATEASRLADERLAKLTEQVDKLVEHNTKPDPADIKPARPERAAFDNPAAYDAAMDAFVDQHALWSARQGQKAAERAIAEQKAAEAATTAETAARTAAEATAKRVVDTFQAAQVKAIEKHADYVEVVSNQSLPITTPMMHALVQAGEVGTEVVYYLGKHPEEAARIAALVGDPQTVHEAHLAVYQASMEIGKLAAKLEAAPKPEVSRTPAPITPVGTRAGAGTKDPSNMSMDEYANTVAEYVASRDARNAVGGRKSAMTMN